MCIIPCWCKDRLWSVDYTLGKSFGVYALYVQSWKVHSNMYLCRWYLFKWAGSIFAAFKTTWDFLFIRMSFQMIIIWIFLQGRTTLKLLVMLRFSIGDAYFCVLNTRGGVINFCDFSDGKTLILGPPLINFCDFSENF